MPLSPAENNQNITEFAAFVAKFSIPEFSNQAADVFAACEKASIVLNSDNQRAMEALFDALFKKISSNDEKALVEWTIFYKKLMTEATQQNAKLHAAQIPGILRSLQGAGQGVAPGTWCEDLDMRTCLKSVMVNPQEVSKPGVYILPPVSSESPEALKDQIDTVIKNMQGVAGSVTLLTPLTHGGHWRLAKITIETDMITGANLWDSLKNSSLDKHPAYQSMKTAISDFRQHFPPITITAEAAGIQQNGWGCGDYVMQEALKVKNEQSDPGLAAIVAAQNPEQLRAAITEKIQVNAGLKLAAEPPPAVDEERLFDFLAQPANKALREKFDALLMEKLTALYREKPGITENLANEKNLVAAARDFAYQQIQQDPDHQDKLAALREAVSPSSAPRL